MWVMFFAQVYISVFQPYYVKLYISPSDIQKNNKHDPQQTATRPKTLVCAWVIAAQNHDPQMTTVTHANTHNVNLWVNMWPFVGHVRQRHDPRFSP